jgi:hypothetical protein
MSQVVRGIIVGRLSSDAGRAVVDGVTTLPPGEVTQTPLDEAIAAALQAAADNSSANSYGVETLDTPMADPDAEILWQKLNELITALPQ